MKSEYWSLIPEKKAYEKTEEEGFSVFPTIVNVQEKTVFCKRCRRWEKIMHFQNNSLLTQCGAVYKDLFIQNNSILNYGYIIKHDTNRYFIKIKSQFVSTEKKRNFSNDFVLDLDRKRLYKNDQAVFDIADISGFLAREVTNEILDEMGKDYKEEFGIKPTITSRFLGFPLIIGYMLSPFNINFYQIAQHWGLNPYDKEFANLSSGNTPTAENEMFDSLGIKPTKAVRKMYQKNPKTVICYAAAKDLGFTDVNLLQKAYSPMFYEFLSANMISFAQGYISYGIHDGLKQFTEDLLRHSDQKTVWNSIIRTADYYMKSSENEISVVDGIQSYIYCRTHLTIDEKKEIMREGFNQYTHDYLVRRVNELSYRAGWASPVEYTETNVVFEIEQNFLDLEYKAGENFKRVYNRDTCKDEYVPVPDEERYCFYVARDSMTLRLIGNEMHNCVGWGYTNAVAERRSTIVYAKYRKKYRICIEVTPNFTIRQSLGPCNKSLKCEDLDAYEEWCKEKHITFKKAFEIHCAP